ncbi:sphingolipid C9-methyltransferase [Thelephora ganbajun]|uniref:Sphingolipid C9-methyltransferase n=1 Tax=Thelephora ganbajun TaxID=370292 RepID=A0ACB6Z3G1_THEGA|nr:sphingolipid C9-methyltransferase [Thelephora ganbajun]
MGKPTSSPSSVKGSSIHITKTPTIKNAPAVGLIDGNGDFSNYHLAALVLSVPLAAQRSLALVVDLPRLLTGVSGYAALLALMGVPVTISYWTYQSRYGKRHNDKIPIPKGDVEKFIEIKDKKLRKKYHGKNKIPMVVFQDAYIAGKVDFKGDVLNVLEHRHEWANFHFTWTHFKFVFTKMLPVVASHSKSADEAEINSQYDRGDDFYKFFLGPNMVYTSGIIKDLHRAETLEELQDNKLTVVCEKLDLQPDDRLLDIGCGWGTLAAFAHKNYKCDVLGITLSRNQTAFGNERIVKSGGDPRRARIEYCDYRDLPMEKGKYTKIVSLEMAEHVGVRRYAAFLRQVYDLLDDNGTFVFQVAGFRLNWQFEDLVWGLYMNRWVFPGADASCALSWVITQVESAGFEVKNVDVLGVHYSATLLRWYDNWISNKDKVIESYGEKWYRIWVYFLASAIIISRNGGCSVFQLTLHKNLNSYPRIEGVKNHASIQVTPKVDISSVSFW